MRRFWCWLNRDGYAVREAALVKAFADLRAERERLHQSTLALLRESFAAAKKPEARK